MLKTFKKSIALFVALVFVLSMVPFAAMADTTEEHYIDVPLSNFGGIRAGKADDGTSYYTKPAYKTYTDFAVMKHSTDGGRNLKYAVYQYDLSGVYKYLLDTNTTMNLVVREAGVANGNTTYAYPYVVYAIPGDHEFSEFSMEYAVNAKLLNAWSGRYLPKYENMYAVASSGEAKHSAKTQVLDVVNISGVKSALDAGDSKMLTLFFQTSVASDTYLNGAYADNYIRINYNPETLDAAILNYYYTNFDWTDVSADSTGSVTSNTKLPATFGDVNISWKADKENVIAEDGSIIEGKQDKAVKLGIHNDDGFADEDRPVLFVKSDGTESSYRTIWPNETEYPNGAPADKEALLQCLDESDTNGVVSVFFEPITRESAFVPTSEKTGIYISYYKSEIDDDAFFADIQSAFAWDAITSDAQEAVVNDLPNYFKGADIVWSSAEGYVTSSGELAIPSDSAMVEDTITANVSYKGNTFTEEFEVKLCDGSLAVGTPALTLEGGVATGTVSVTNATGADVKYQLYVAVYSDGEMVNLVPLEFTATKGALSSKDLVANDIPAGAKVKFLVWEYGKTTPATVAKEK